MRVPCLEVQLGVVERVLQGQVGGIIRSRLAEYGNGLWHESPFDFGLQSSRQPKADERLGRLGVRLPDAFKRLGRTREIGPVVFLHGFLQGR